MQRDENERLSLAAYIALRYEVALYPEADGGFVAEIEDLPGCLTQGDSLAEVTEGIEDARRLWIETAFIYGDKIPLPS